MTLTFLLFDASVVEDPSAVPAEAEASNDHTAGSGIQGKEAPLRVGPTENPVVVNELPGPA